VRDPDLRARMGEAGRQRALDRYDEAKVLERTLDLLGL
jgi:glycosyltransferase involved in cell wall biosynthesis